MANNAPHPLQPYLNGLPDDVQQQFMALANAGTGAVSSGQPSPTQQDRYDPTDGMSTTDKVLAGVGRGMVNIGRHAANLVGLESDQDLADAKAVDTPLMNTTAGKVGNFVGETAATLPLMGGASAGLGALGAGAVARGVGEGALQGLLTADPGQRGIGTVAGAATGSLLPLAGMGLNRFAAGVTRTPEAQTLLNAGVNKLSPGQVAGPTSMLNRAEQAVAETPVLGDIVKNARKAPIKQYTQAKIADAMAPGAPMPSGLSDPNEMIEAAANSYKGAYTPFRQYPVQLQTPGPNGPVPLANALQAAISKPRLGVTMSARNEIGSMLQEQLGELSSANPNGITSGNLIDLRSQLRDAIRDIPATTNASRATRALYQDAANQVTTTLNSQLPPKVSAALQATDAQYAKYSIMRDAVASAGDQNVTPFKISRAIAKATDKSDYAKGGGLGRDLSKAAMDTFQEDVPKTGLSGAGRIGLPAMAIGAAAHFFPEQTAHAAMYAAPLAAAYLGALTPWGRSVMLGNSGLQRSLSGFLGSLPSGAASDIGGLAARGSLTNALIGNRTQQQRSSDPGASADAFLQQLDAIENARQDSQTSGSTGNVALPTVTGYSR